MDERDLIRIATEYVETGKENYISKEMAISENLVGLRIFKPSIFAFGNPDDHDYHTLKESSVIGKNHLYPKEWMPQTKTVISFFLPFSQEVIASNNSIEKWPSSEWLHGRIEGQMFINRFIKHLIKEIEEQTGCASLSPSLDPRFAVQKESKINNVFYSSNWSERHVAYICGLGTFGLSKGLITSKGMAGRLGSILTQQYFTHSEKEYHDIYEYCSKCGACIQKCPVCAITMNEGKNHMICSRFIDQIAEKYNPRYACGKCQVGVPCEQRIPKQKS